MRKFLFASAALVAALFACQGPPADDAAVCRDVVRRVCAEPLCETMQQRLGIGRDCISALTTRAGCDEDGFAWGENNRPSRDRVLECRLPLIRSGDSVDNSPSCTDIDEMFDRCNDMERLLTLDGGTQ